MNKRSYPNRIRRKTNSNPIKLAYIDNRWLIAQSAGGPAAGSIPASLFEIELWQELQEARSRLAALEAILEADSHA